MLTISASRIDLKNKSSAKIFGLFGAICTNCFTINTAKRCNSSLCLSFFAWRTVWNTRNSRACICFYLKKYVRTEYFRCEYTFNLNKQKNKHNETRLTRLTWNSITGILHLTAMWCRIATVDFNDRMGICRQSTRTVVQARTTFGLTSLLT